jgi:nicotinamidase/pyrazinamidase
MTASSRREFLESAAAGAVVAGIVGRASAAAAQGTGKKIKPAATDVFLVIDVQNCFVPGGTLPVKEGDQIVPLINRLAKGFRT